MRLANAGRPEQQHILAVGDPARRGEVSDLFGIDRGLRLEVEAGEFLHRREVRKLQGHLDAPVVLPRDLALAQQDECLACRQVRPRGFVEQAVELITDATELETHQHGVEWIGRRLGCLLDAGHQKRPPMAASYSANGRSNDGAGAGGTAGPLTALRQTDPSRPATPSRWAGSMIR